MGWPEWKGEKSPIYFSLQTGDISCNIPPERGDFGCNGSPETRIGGGGAGNASQECCCSGPGTRVEPFKCYEATHERIGAGMEWV